MRVLCAGGGSGGHVTPVRAVINELNRLSSDIEVHFVCDRNFAERAKAIMRHADVDVSVSTIKAGKLRRYHGVSLIKQLLDIPTTMQNIVDMFFVCIGTIQSLLLMRSFKPEVVFTKGGFVCLPIGIAAHVLKIPLVIHDSDAHPGLTNRILARWASWIATGAPLENYPSYPGAITRYTGIPVDKRFRKHTYDEVTAAKAAIGLVDITKPLVVVTGGGLGAKKVNQVTLAVGQKLIDDGISVYHITGDTQYAEVEKAAPHDVSYKTVPFAADNMHEVLAAADVVVTRAGATTLLELAALAKPIIIIPNPMLTGGHQLKNAAVYEAARAAIVLREETLTLDAELLYKNIMRLVQHTELAQRIGESLYAFAKPNAATHVAELIVKGAKG